MHPLVRLAASRPQMLAEHAAAYVELLAEEATTAATLVKRQVSLQLIGVGLLAVGVILGGVALMLWASFPTLNSPWALALTPCIPILAGAIALHSASSKSARDPFAPLQRQLAADAAMLKRAGE
ncbi:MAG TPA: hypothetical protein VL379_12920 [Pseudomonadales bacterium]|jgi:hypothetical protein|nr:hypothetical protein [Pseudomonadales bacterium]